MVGRVVAMQNDGKPLVMFGAALLGVVSSQHRERMSARVGLSSEFLGDQKN